MLVAENKSKSKRCLVHVKKDKSNVGSVYGEYVERASLKGIHGAPKCLQMEVGDSNSIIGVKAHLYSA